VISALNNWPLIHTGAQEINASPVSARILKANARALQVSAMSKMNKDHIIDCVPKLVKPEFQISIFILLSILPYEDPSS
jgi:hypothetical protein